MPEVNKFLSTIPAIIYSSDPYTTLQFEVTGDGPHIVKYSLESDKPLSFRQYRKGTRFSRDIYIEINLFSGIVNTIETEVKFNNPDYSEVEFKIIAMIVEDISGFNYDNIPGSNWTFAGSCVCTYI